jgi:integrase/recombinase XerD
MEQTFEQYLKRIGHSDQTLRTYRCAIKVFLQRHPDAHSYGYGDVLNYMEELGKTDVKVNTKIGKLNALKKYYDYLIDQGKRENHPCRTLLLKGGGKRGAIFHDLFTSGELESLLEREEKFAHLKTKNQVVISLLIYQGLLPGEIINLKLHHIDLDAGTIFIKGGRLLTARKLEMHPKQFRLFDKYLTSDRKRLLIKGETGFFIINYRGHADKIDGPLFLIETLKPRFPDRNLTTTAIRDSVIANLLNEKKMPLEQVQLFAGHRWICSTQRYLQTPVEEQRDVLRMFHPMK